MLRALRQHPPGLASANSERRKLFVASLEQSEQFFRAASSAPVQTRALLLFYGISQAGRAVRAAQQHDEWSRSGTHGLSVVGPSLGGTFADTRLKDQGSSKTGAFISVAKTLARSTLGTEVRVGDLAGLLFPDALSPLALHEPQLPVLGLEAVRTSQFGAISTRVATGLRADLTVPATPWARELPEPPDRVTADYDSYRSHLRQLLADYPTIADAELFEASPGYVQLKSTSVTHRRLELIWPDLPGWDGVTAGPLHSFSDENESSVAIWPALRASASSVADADRSATHPFLLWWAVLFAAAHYIRYEPTTWATLVDVDTSEEAIALEEVSDLALDAVPELMHRTMVRTEPQ